MARSRWASSSRSTTRIPICRRSRNCSAGRLHPAIRAEIEGGKRVCYGARAINEGGWQAIPKLAFPGGALIGCAAGFVNVPRIKGSHTAIKSAMLAAEAAFEALGADRRHDTLEAYEPAVRSSWIADELKMVRNAQPAIAKWGGTIGTLFAGLRHVAQLSEIAHAVDAQAPCRP